MQGNEIIEETVTEKIGASPKKKVFVAGATGSTGKRIVDQLLARGFAVKAGVRDLEKAKSAFSRDDPSLQFVSSLLLCYLFAIIRRLRVYSAFSMLVNVFLVGCVWSRKSNDLSSLACK